MCIRMCRKAFKNKQEALLFILRKLNILSFSQIMVREERHMSKFLRITLIFLFFISVLAVNAEKPSVLNDEVKQYEIEGIKTNISVDETASNGLLIFNFTESPGKMSVKGVEDGKEILEEFRWWDWSGSIDIPDGPDGDWTGINCNAPSGIPDGSYVTKVRVHHEITHSYIGDLEVKIYNSSHTWMVRDNEGGSDDDINETVTEYSLFDGDDPAQNWYYRVRDTAQYDTGTLEVMQLYVYYEVPSAAELTIEDWDCENEPWYWGGTAQVDLDVYNSGGTAADAWFKIIASSDTILWDADDHIIRDWHVTIDPGDHYYLNNYTWTLPSTPYPNMPESGLVYYYIHIGNPFDLNDYDMVTMNMLPADLSVQYVHASDGSYNPGDSININNLTDNIGAGDSEPYTVSFYASENTIISEQDWFMQAYNRPELPSGSSHSYNSTPGLPGDIDPGDYYIGMIVDCPNDENETNDVGYDGVPVSVLTDLSLNSSGCYVNPSTIAPGGRITVCYRICNPHSGAVYVGLGCSIRKNGTGGDWISDSDDDVYVDASHGTSNHVRYFDIPSDADPGSYDVGWGLWETIGAGDYWDYMEKYNQFTVQQAYSDLSVQSVDAADGIYCPGDTVDVDNVITNIGDAYSDAYRVDFYASLNTIISSSDHHLGYVQRSSLAPGATHSYVSHADLPADIPYDDYYIGLIVDCDNDDNSDNDTGYDSTQITVEPPGGSLHVTVNNIGDAPQEGVQVYLYDSDWNQIGDPEMTDSSGTVYWSYVEEGNDYKLEAYFNEEFWCNNVDVDIAAGNTTNVVMDRNMPYISAVRIKNASGQETTEFAVGETVTVEIDVKHPLLTGYYNSKVRILIDKDQSTPYDFESPLSDYQTIWPVVPTVFTFEWTIPEEGSYKIRPFCYTDFYGDWPLTDHWDWGHSFSAGVAEWTFMVFLNGDNNLEAFAILDFLEMSDIGSTNKVNLILQIDLFDGNDNPYGSWSHGKKGLINIGDIPDDDWGMDILPDPDMGDENELIDFAEWAIDIYPANHYALIVWDHGNGWYKTKRGSFWKNKGVSSDSTNNNKISIAEGEWETAISAIKTHLGKKIDIIGFDACLMQMLEVAYINKDYADYMVGSEELVKGQGWSYDSFLDDLTTDFGMSPSTLGELIVSTSIIDSGQRTQSLVDLSKIDEVVLTIDAFSDELINANVNSQSDEIESIRAAVQKFDLVNDHEIKNIDLYDLALKVYNNTLFPQSLKNSANALINDLNNAIVLSMHDQSGDYDHSYGMAIYYPENPPCIPHEDYCFDESYNQLTFAEDTHWDEFISMPYQPNLYDDGEYGRSFSPRQATSGEAGQSFEIHCNIRNGGEADSGGFSVQFYASLDENISSADYFIGEEGMPSISVGNYDDCDWSGYFPTDIPSGTYWIGWIIDADEEVCEGDETDNTAYKEGYQLNVIISDDTDPPTPDPMTWATVPSSLGTTEIGMLATTASDGSPPVEYYFNFYGSPTGGYGGDDSDWQIGVSYVDDDLVANHQYGYRVKARDSSPSQNETAYSGVVYSFTDIETPSGITFGSVTKNSIEAKSTNTPSRLTVGSSGLIVENVTQGPDSGWKQDNDFWECDSLSVNTIYEFKAKARNGDGIETDYCSVDYRYTLAENPGTDDFSDITHTSIRANWTHNGNPGHTEYYCENTDTGADSGWITGMSWNCTNLEPDTTYHFRVKARNGDQVETAWTDLGSAATLSGPVPTSTDTPLMTATPEATPRPSATPAPTGIPGQVVISLTRGWNMISVPLELDDPDPESFLPPNSFIYRWNPLTFQYYPVTEVQVGQGYWVSADSAADIVLEGHAPSSYVMDLSRGWNMLGSLIDDQDFSDPNDVPDGSVLVPVYWWSPETKSYDFSTIIESKKGYWTAAEQDCVLWLP